MSDGVCDTSAEESVEMVESSGDSCGHSLKEVSAIVKAAKGKEAEGVKPLDHPDYLEGSVRTLVYCVPVSTCVAGEGAARPDAGFDFEIGMFWR